jgi:hypothetical protein
MFSMTHFIDTGACVGCAARITPIFRVVHTCSSFGYPMPAIIRYLPLLPKMNARPVPSHYQQELNFLQLHFRFVTIMVFRL